MLLNTGSSQSLLLSCIDLPDSSIWLPLARKKEFSTAEKHLTLKGGLNFYFSSKNPKT